MIKKIVLVCFVVFSCSSAFAQKDTRIKIIEEKVANRLMLYAQNETDNDLDVMITIDGTGFRQSKAKPRLTRVPAISKVNVGRLMLIKGEDPKYTYDLVVSDSLSRRALRRDFEKIKIAPKKLITVYITENCKSCDSIIQPLEDSKWEYTRFNLAEKPEIASQLKMAVPNIETMETPVFSLGGLLFPKVKTYEELMEEMAK